MRSPFPGMDPYLEDPAIWPDFHLTLIVALRPELNRDLPQGYVAMADRHKWRFGVAATATLAAPRSITLPVQEHKGTPYLKITDSLERRVVTVIEVLSPTNKTPGPHRNEYLSKREEYFNSGVNVVEVNLLRKGKNPPLGEEDRSLAETPYYIMVCRTKEWPRADLWTFGIRDLFPDFSLPLRGKQQIIVNLRKSVDRAFEEGRYHQDIDYAKPPTPPLREAEAAWMRELTMKPAQRDS